MIRKSFQYESVIERVVRLGLCLVCLHFFIKHKKRYTWIKAVSICSWEDHVPYVCMWVDLHLCNCAVLCKSLTLPLIHFYFATEKSRVVIFKVVLSYSFPGFFHTFSPVFVPGFSEECFLFFFFLLTQLTLTYESIKHKEEPNKPVLCLHVTDNLSNN